MSTTSLPDPADRRAARRAAAKAQAVTFGPPETLIVSDLRVGDWLEIVPSQSGVRGARVQAVITGTSPSWDSWGVTTPGRRRRTPVVSTQLRFGVQPTSAWSAGLDVPNTFTCTARRPL